MRHRVYEDEDGRHVTELDAEAIDYLIDGLEQLRDSEPGTELFTPTVVRDDDDGGMAASEFVLLRAEDVPTPDE